MAPMLRIVNGRVYDPANGLDGEVQDICIRDGRIVADVPPDARTIDARGMVVMPGGVDIHCHIAGSKVNLARKLQPDDHRRDPHLRTRFTRSGTGGTVPSTFATGYRYAALGYTTAMEAAISPLGARHTLEEFHDTPVIDKGFFILMGNNVLLYRLLQEGRHEEFRHALAWWLSATKAYAPKLVNPGSDELWKGQRNANIALLDDKIGPFDLTPRKVIDAFIGTANDLGLPHPVHIHCNNLGHTGNYDDHPRDDEDRRRPAGPHHPYPVPQLRIGGREERRQPDLPGARHLRVRQHPPQHQRRRRRRDVRPLHQHDGRRAAGLYAPPFRGREVGERRHRA